MARLGQRGSGLALKVGHRVLTVMFEISASYVNASGWMLDTRIARVTVRAEHKVLECLVVDGGPAHGDN